MALQSTTALATITLQSASSEVFFTSIPGTYRDLVLVSLNATQNESFRQYRLQVNGDTGGNYSIARLDGNGSAASGSVDSGQIEVTLFSTGTGSTFATIISHFIDYSATDKHKTMLHRINAPDATVGVSASRWASTAAITSIRVFTPAGQFQAGSTFVLYGRVS